MSDELPHQDKMLEKLAANPVETVRELENFEAIAAHVVPSPGDLPKLAGIDIYGKSIPLNGIIGGDHIIYVDFKKRYDLEARIQVAREMGREDIVANLISCKSKAGIALADVSGHRITDGLLALMLHQSFLLGAIYELDFYGHITTRLFENLNSRFFKSSSVSKFLTLLYGEISQDGNFKFISAAHPNPLVFSRKYDRIVDICSSSITTFPPIGTMPSRDDVDRRTTHTVLPYKDRYTINEINLMGEGDILLLCTDGLYEHARGEEPYFPTHVENLLRELKDRTSREIFEALQEDLMAFEAPEDDISVVLIKKG